MLLTSVDRGVVLLLDLALCGRDVGLSGIAARELDTSEGGIVRLVHNDEELVETLEADPLRVRVTAVVMLNTDELDILELDIFIFSPY